MQASEIKKYISKDEERIITILEFYNFHSIWSKGSEIRCASPQGDNKTAVSIKVDGLFATYYSDSSPYRGDLIGLCQHVSNEDFKTTLTSFHAILGLPMKKEKSLISKEYNPLIRMNNYLKKQQRNRPSEPNELHDISVLSRFTKLTHPDLYKEAILPKVAELFHVGFDPKNNRITFPHFDWKEHDKVVGIQGRIVEMTSEEASLLGVPKYWNYIKGYKKSLNLYGWNFAEENIKKHKKLIIFEAEKSVLKQFSYENGEGFSVAVGGHEISKEQVNFIIEHTPADCEIIIAFDRDVVKDKDYMTECCKMFANSRDTSYLFFGGKVFGEKDSPIDKGYKLFNILINDKTNMMRRYIHGEDEQRNSTKSLQSRGN